MPQDPGFAVDGEPEDSERRRASRVAIFFLNLKRAGGVQIMLINTARELVARGMDVDLVVAGEIHEVMARRLPDGARVISLARSRVPWWHLWRALQGTSVPLPIKPPRASRFLPPLIRYFRNERPDALISACTFYNLSALWARKLAGVSTRILVSERTSLSTEMNLPDKRGKWQYRHAPQLLAAAYGSADAIVGVSRGVSEETAEIAGLPSDSVRTIYNPVVDDSIERRAAEQVDHPWIAPGKPPLLLAAGRLHPVKDFPTLIRAFAKVRAERPARLVILGEGPERGKLEALIAELGLSGDVALPGFTSNPFAWMSKARVFVLSSLYEGLPTVIIEALACGCPVISTDCPRSGPAEILEGGRYGALVPVGDVDALARAITTTLDQPPDRCMLQARAAEFTVERAVEQYLDALGISPPSSGEGVDLVEGESRIPPSRE